MKIRALALALALLFVAGSTSPFALAGEKGEKGALWKKAWEHHLKKMDTNHDGMISKDEIEAAVAAEKAAHANQPKPPKPAPSQTQTTPHPHKHVPHVHLLRDFDKIDTNHDGKISAEEFEAAFKEAVEEARKLNEENGTGGTKPAPAPAPAPSTSK